MKETTVHKLNGVGVIFRFLTPLMVGLLMAMISQDMAGRRELKQDIASIRLSIDNHVATFGKEQTAIRERVSRIEGKLDDALARWSVKR